MKLEIRAFLWAAFILNRLVSSSTTNQCRDQSDLAGNDDTIALDNDLERDLDLPALSRKRRLVEGIGCFTVIQCTGFLIKIFPLRWNINLVKLYDRYLVGE